MDRPVVPIPSEAVVRLLHQILGEDITVSVSEIGPSSDPLSPFNTIGVWLSPTPDIGERAYFSVSFHPIGK
jgi:hypothetical protein